MSDWADLATRLTNVLRLSSSPIAISFRSTPPSRARTGMPPEEMTCAIPGSRLEDAVARLEEAAEVDRRMARYAATDAKRFRSDPA